MPIFNTIRDSCRPNRLCHLLPIFLSVFLLFNSNQTSSFAESTMRENQFIVKIDQQYAAKVTQQLNHQQKSRYAINLFDYTSEESISAFFRPAFGKITDVFVEKNHLTVLMEGRQNNKQLLVIDSYHIEYDINDRLRLHHKRELPLDLIKTRHNVFNEIHKMPKQLHRASGYVIIE